MDSLILKRGTLSSSKSVATIYHSKQHNIPEIFNLHQHHSKTIKLNNIFTLCKDVSYTAKCWHQDEDKIWSTRYWQNSSPQHGTIIQK